MATIRDKSFKSVTIEGKEQLNVTNNTSQSLYSTCIKDKPKRLIK